MRATDRVCPRAEPPGSYQMNLSIEPLSTRHFRGTRRALAPAKVPKCLAREDFGDNHVADVRDAA